MFATMTTSTRTAAPSDPVSRRTSTRSLHRRSTPLLDELDREWIRLDRRPSTWRVIRSWTEQGALTLPAPVADLDELVALTQPTSGERPTHDEILRDLVGLASIDAIAGRIVLQRILPGVISGARRWMSRDRATDPIDVAIGAAWLAIRGFDLERRHCAVAPALVADSLWIGFRRDARRKADQELSMASDVLSTHPAPDRRLDPTTAIAGTLRAAHRAGVPATDLELVRHLVRTGSPSVTATERGVSPRTIRNHRDTATARIRSALGADWSDWADPLTVVT
jgi:hypothetical protein